MSEKDFNTCNQSKNRAHHRARAGTEFPAKFLDFNERIRTIAGIPDPPAVSVGQTLAIHYRLLFTKAADPLMAADVAPEGLKEVIKSQSQDHQD